MLHRQIVRENDGEEHIEAIIHWLYAGGSTLFRKKLKGWTSFREASKNQGMEYFRILQTEFNQLQKMCERKCDLLGYQKSWQNIMDICCEEKKEKRRDSGVQSTQLQVTLVEAEERD